MPDEAQEAPPRLSDAVVRLDDTFRRLRRWMSHPPASARLDAVIERFGESHEVVEADPAKVAACEAVASLREEGPVAVGDVAAHLSLERSTVSRLLGDCERLGLVAREHDPADRRRVHVTLTERGEILAEQTAGVRRRLMEQLVSDWPDDELAMFIDRFEQLSGRIGRIVGEVVAGRVPAELEAALLGGADPAP